MFENRMRGAELVKRLSYLYIGIAAFVLIVILIFGFIDFFIAVPFYIIMSIVLYLLSTRFKNNKYTWIYVIICAAITLLWTLNLFGVMIFLLLSLAANDMKKELD